MGRSEKRLKSSLDHVLVKHFIFKKSRYKWAADTIFDS